MRNFYRAYQRSGIKPSNFFLSCIQGKLHRGHCPICESEVTFIKKADWLRDNYFCLECYSIPRQRALVETLKIFFPEWMKMRIHESSPGGVSSTFIQKFCQAYVPTQFFQDIPSGEYKDGMRCENLEAMTFADNSFDLMVTQDVFEHVMNPRAAFKEIERVLSPGGAHIFTIPWYPKLEKSIQRATMVDGDMFFLQEPIYHGNPISSEGSLVTYDWGLDFTDFIYDASGMFTTIYLAVNRNMGLEAEFLEVFVSRKSLGKVNYD